MAVAAQKQGTRFAEAAALEGMADAVAGFGQDQSVFLGNGLQVDVVIRSLVVNLQQIVIDVAHGQFRPYPVQIQSFKSQVGHHRIDIVGQGLIHRHLDFLSGDQLRRFCQMGRKQFLCQIHCHGHSLLFPLGIIFIIAIFFTLIGYHSPCRLYNIRL